jgi:hypothetical protein
LGCALGSWKRQQICRSTESSSIGSCGIGCCGGGVSVGAAAAGCTVTVGGSRVRPGRGRRCAQASPSRLALRARGSGNLPQHRKQQHWQLRHRLLRWRWQCGSGSGGLHRNGRGQPGAAWSGQEVCSGFALAARATRSRLGLRPRGSASPTYNNQTAKQRPQKLLRRLCRLSAAYLPQR